jgi:hypothetical protein
MPSTMTLFTANANWFDSESVTEASVSQPLPPRPIALLRLFCFLINHAVFHSPALIHPLLDLAVECPGG